MQSVPSQHTLTNDPQTYVEGGMYDLSLFLQSFVKDLTHQLETTETVDGIHQWANAALPTFLGQAERRTNALRDTMLSILAQQQQHQHHHPGGALSSVEHSPHGGAQSSLVMLHGVAGNALTPTGAPQMMHFAFDATSPRSHRVQSIDTLIEHGSSSRTNSMVRLPPRDGESLQDADHHQPASGGGLPQLPPSISPSNMSRPGSFSNRMGSFTRKHFNGIEVPMLKDDASGAVVDALNDTYSLASRGSYRRRVGPPSVQPGSSSVQPSHAMNGIKRRAYLSFVNLDGMPNLNIDVEDAELRTRFSRPSKRHTAVFRDSADLESLLDECNLPRIHDVNSLEFNIFEEFQKYGDNAFMIVVMNILLKYSFVTAFNFKIPSLLTFVKTIQSFYRSENPYHNALHAADVLQTTHLYLCQRDVKENFSDVELFALLFAATCIDVGHLGVNNHFLTKVHHPIATLYSDTSPMEAMSCALAFCILDDPDCNFVQDSVVWDREVETVFRSLATDLILRSDDCEHAAMAQDVDVILARGIIGDDAVPQLLSAVLHAADVSYMCKPRHIYLEWACRFMAENYRQGDAEKEYAEMYRTVHADVPVDAETKWLKVSKLCDRAAMDAAELQQSIMEHIVLPFVTLLQPFLPTVWVERLEANFRYLKIDGMEKTIVLQNGVAEQLWKKGVATTWFDVPPSSGKNFLQVIRNWISCELPDGGEGGAGGGGGSDAVVQQPSKVAAEIITSLSAQTGLSCRNSTSSRPSNVSELDEQASSNMSKGQMQQNDMLKVSKDGGGKKRLSVSQIPSSSGVGSPTLASGLNSVHIITGEMLKHMHTLLHAGSPGSWDASRETAIFAQAWVKLLRTLEAQDSGPALLSTLATNNQLRALTTTSHTSEESESIAVIEVLRDQTSPFAHFRPGKMATAAQNSSGGGVELMRRESVNDMLLSNSPFACAILLTQMWWIVFGMVEDTVANDSGEHGHGAQRRIMTPTEPGIAEIESDEELSVSQKGGQPPPIIEPHQQRGSTTGPSRFRRTSQPKYPAAGGGGGRNSLESQELPRGSGPAAGRGDSTTQLPPPQQQQQPVPRPPASPKDEKPSQQQRNAGQQPSDGEQPHQTSPSAPAPPTAIREMMQSTGRRLSAATAGSPPLAAGQPVTGGGGTVPPRRASGALEVSPMRAPPQQGGPLAGTGQTADPSPVKYVLQRRGSLQKTDP